MLRLIEKDLDTVNDWRNVDGAPLFNDYAEVLRWLETNEYRNTDNLRLIDTGE